MMNDSFAKTAKFPAFGDRHKCFHELFVHPLKIVDVPGMTNQGFDADLILQSGHEHNDVLSDAEP